MESTVAVQGRRAYIRFPYDEDLVDLVRDIPGRRFHNESGEKFWSVPARHSEELDDFIDEAAADVIDPNGVLKPGNDDDDDEENGERVVITVDGDRAVIDSRLGNELLVLYPRLSMFHLPGDKQTSAA